MAAPEPVAPKHEPEAEKEPETDVVDEDVVAFDEPDPEPELEPDEPLVSWSSEDTQADEPAPEYVDRYVEYDDVQEIVHEAGPRRYEDLDDDPEDHFIVDDIPDDPATGDQPRRAGD